MIDTNWGNETADLPDYLEKIDTAYQLFYGGMYLGRALEVEINQSDDSSK